VTREEILDLVKTTFVAYGVKTVSATDVNKSAYVPNMEQKRIFEFFDIDPMERRQDISVKELFTNRDFTISYYATLRVGANRPPEPRMGLRDLISYMSIGDEILFTHDSHNIYIYNITQGSTDETEDAVYSQINMELLANRANNVNPRPGQIQQTVRVYPRNNILKNYVKRRSNHACEMPNCDYIAFTKMDGEKYIEIHHVVPLSEDGEDSVLNTVALCPNCHRALHYANNKEELRQVLLDYLSSL